VNREGQKVIEACKVSQGVQRCASGMGNTSLKATCVLLLALLHRESRSERMNEKHSKGLISIATKQVSHQAMEQDHPFISHSTCYTDMSREHEPNAALVEAKWEESSSQRNERGQHEYRP
jgi:hypothetical protein